MATDYMPHKSGSPYELLAIAILYQAYRDIYSYYKSGQPSDHEGKEAIEWIQNGKNNKMLKTIIHAIQLVNPTRGTKLEIKKNLVKNISRFQKLAENGNGIGHKDEEQDFQKAWQLMSN